MDVRETVTMTVLSEPKDMEMSRTEVGPPDENENQHLKSLAQKFKDHYSKGMKKKKRTLDNALTPEVLNKFAVPLFLFTFVATIKIGVLDVMPLIYAGNDWLVICHQFIVLFIGAQMFMNWLGIRYITSTYTSYKKRFEKEETLKKDQFGFNKQISKISSDSSSAPLMPLVTETNETNLLLQAANNKYNEENQAHEITRDLESDLTEQVRKANQEMHRRLDEETNGIKDLIKASDEMNSLRSGRHLTGEGEDSVKFPTPVVTATTKTVTYPYWSWTPCFKCNCTRPPRCHHCPLCKACILKRDHHCYFAGSCVGYRNLRYFYIFLIWSWMGSMWATIHGFPYIYLYLWEDMSYVDIIFFFAIVRWLFGFISFQAALSVTTLTILIYFDMITTTFIYAHTQLINWGLTSFEKAFLRKSTVIQDTRTKRKKMQAVFGKNWFYMFFTPIHFFVEPDEDPVNWPHIKVFKNSN